MAIYRCLDFSAISKLHGVLCVEGTDELIVYVYGQGAGVAPARRLVLVTIQPLPLSNWLAYPCHGVTLTWPGNRIGSKAARRRRSLFWLPFKVTILLCKQIRDDPVD